MNEWQAVLKKNLFNNIGYTFRRYYIDDFYFRYISKITDKSLILDIGGKKTHKRGCFKIEDYNSNTHYINIDHKTNPDLFCDAGKLSIKNNQYDLVILSEILEHVNNPLLVLQESFRVLKPGGLMFITIPFMIFVHNDPQDYGRYTDTWFNENLIKVGFKNIEINKQGLFFSVLMNMMKQWCNEISKSKSIKARIITKIFAILISLGIRITFSIESKGSIISNKMFSGHTTGYGIICSK